MKRIRITALRKTEYSDLMALYENPMQAACSIRVGDVFVSEEGRKPEGLCDSAWETMAPFAKALAEGAEGLFDGWMKNPRSLLLSCNDGFRPVSFLVETIEDLNQTP